MKCFSSDVMTAGMAGGGGGDGGTIVNIVSILLINPNRKHTRRIWIMASIIGPIRQ